MRTITPMAPIAKACFCCFSGRSRHASAMTTALSPLSRMLMTQIWNSAIQMSGLLSDSITCVAPVVVGAATLGARTYPPMAGADRGLSAGLRVACRGITAAQARRGGGRRRGRIGVVVREGHHEGVADAVAVFLQPDLRAVQRGDVAHDGKAQAAALGMRAEQAVEALEHAVALLHRDARAVVAHHELAALA